MENHVGRRQRDAEALERLALAQESQAFRMRRKLVRFKRKRWEKYGHVGLPYLVRRTSFKIRRCQYATLIEAKANHDASPVLFFRQQFADAASPFWLRKSKPCRWIRIG
jgi:hypothetical protein